MAAVLQKTQPATQNGQLDSRLWGAPRSKYDEPAVDDLIADAPAANIGYNLQLIRGVPRNPLFDRAQFEGIIDNFATRDTDTYVCLCESGHDLRRLTLLLNGASKARSRTAGTVPWLRRCALSSSAMAS